MRRLTALIRLLVAQLLVALSSSRGMFNRLSHSSRLNVMILILRNGDPILERPSALRMIVFLLSRKTEASLSGSVERVRLVWA